MTKIQINSTKISLWKTQNRGKQGRFFCGKEKEKCFAEIKEDRKKILG